ncbi:MAG: HAMP domain-containing protein, partial [Candidatus Poribacteria bacterium]|nr:HAMP domain-containing protein [Candidatus Poribacteria bacterium]
MRLLSIRNKIGLSVTLLIALIALFSGWFYPRQLEQQAMAAVEEKAKSIASMTAFSISSAFVFEDPDAAADTFAGAQQNSDVIYVVAVTPTGDVFAAYNEATFNETPKYVTTTSGSVSRDGMTYRIATPIIHNNEAIGSLYLGLSLREVRATVQDSFNTSMLVSVVVFVISVLVAVIISAVITRPLNQVVSAVNGISGGDLTQRASIASRDEVGDLAQAFNQMVDRLHAARTELEGVNQNLERRVEERTKDLQREIEVRNRTALELIEAKEVAEQASQAKSDFLSRMSHELRTP